MTDDYETFIAGKAAYTVFEGLNVTDFDAPLFPHQRDIARWALRKGRAAIFADTGLGKSRMALAWADQVARKGRVLLLTPLAVAQQFVREGDAVGIPCRYLRADDGLPGIIVTNYEMLERFDASSFVGVIIDECFAANTMVDTPSGPVEISAIKVGDSVHNAYGVDVVSDVHRREVQYATKVTINGRSCIASPNHPFFTQRGWVGAQDLRAGDFALESSAAVRLVRDGVCSEVPGSEGAAFLQSVLFSELADEPAGAPGQSPYAGGSSQEGCQEERLVQERNAGVRGGARADNGAQPNIESRDTGKDLPHIESHEARSFRAWRKREGFDQPSVQDAGGFGKRMAGGAELVIGPTGTRLSNELQTRHSQSRGENRHRGGWTIASQPQEPGCEEGCPIGFARVEGSEILESGHPELDRFRDAEGKLYFYDLGATRHPSFSVNGVLVHNSSILKAFDGKTRTLIIDTFKETPYRLACTATPAPNDFAELGNHSEFLGIKTRTEMLAEYFVHDGETTQEWRLKGHAQTAFWKWVASWAAIIQKPSDLGYDDGAYALPPLRVHEHIIPVDIEDAHRAGQLFAVETRTLSDQRANRRATIDKRIAKAAEFANAGTTPCIVWCELNAEGDGAEAQVDDAVQVAGADSLDEKIEKLAAFADGRARVMVTKASVAGFGLNWQHCARMVFLGASHSFEMTYQAIRRCWRFGQSRPVDVHFIRAENEGAIMANYRRKEADAAKMAAEMREHSRDAVRSEVLGGTGREWNEYNPQVTMETPSWLVTEQETQA